MGELIQALTELGQPFQGRGSVFPCLAFGLQDVPIYKPDGVLEVDMRDRLQVIKEPQSVKPVPLLAHLLQEIAHAALLLLVCESDQQD